MPLRANLHHSMGADSVPLPKAKPVISFFSGGGAGNTLKKPDLKISAGGFKYNERSVTGADVSSASSYSEPDLKDWQSRRKAVSGQSEAERSEEHRSVPLTVNQTEQQLGQTSDFGGGAGGTPCKYQNGLNALLIFIEERKTN